MSRKKVLVLFLLGTLLISFSATAQDIRVFPILYADAQVLLKLVRVALSKNDHADYNPSNNSIVVRDDSTSLRRIEKLIKSHDLPIKRVKIKAYRTGRSELENLEAQINWKIKNGQWAAGTLAKTEKGTFSDVHADKKFHSSSMASMKKMIVPSGSTANLITGKVLVADNSKFAFSETFGFIMTGMRVSHVQTGLLINPIITKAGVKLTITPLLNVFSGLKAEQKPISYAKLVVDVPDGGRLLIGPDDDSGSGIITKIFQGLSPTIGLRGNYLLIEVEIQK